MFVDIFILVLLLGGMVSGWFSGGFREVLRIAVLLVLMAVVALPSVRSVMPSGGSFAIVLNIVIFSAAWTALYYLLFWVLKGVITVKEGVWGSFNRALGIFFGFVKTLLIVVFFVYLASLAFRAGLLVEWKQPCSHSVIFSVIRQVLSYVQKV